MCAAHYDARHARVLHLPAIQSSKTPAFKSSPPNPATRVAYEVVWTMLFSPALPVIFPLSQVQKAGVKNTRLTQCQPNPSTRPTRPVASQEYNNTLEYLHSTPNTFSPVAVGRGNRCPTLKAGELGEGLSVGVIRRLGCVSVRGCSDARPHARTYFNPRSTFYFQPVNIQHVRGGMRHLLPSV